MKLPFLSDALQKETAASATAAAKLAELRAERQRILHSDADDLAAVIAADAAIGAQERICGVHQERVTAISRELSKEREAQRQGERQALIDKHIKPKAVARVAKAAKLESLIKQMGDAYFDLIGSEPIVDDRWPFGSLPARFGVIDADAIQQEVAWALYSAGRPIGGRTTLPGPTNAGLGVTGVSPKGIAAVVAGQSESLLAHLREMPISEGAQ